MKNKTVQRVLSFTLALILCFSFAVKPIEAKALAVESWVIYALITYMAAAGITFTAVGGAEAMVKAVQEKVLDYKVTGYDLMGMLMQSIRFNGGGDGNGPSFWFTVSALVAIKEFIEWLKGDEVWGAGETVEIGNGVYLRCIYNGADIDFITPVIGNSLIYKEVSCYEVLNEPTFIHKSELEIDGNFAIYLNDNRTNQRTKHSFALNSALKINRYRNDGSLFSTYDMSSLFNKLGLTYNDDFYLTFSSQPNSNGIFGVLEIYLFAPELSDKLFRITSTSTAWVEWDGFYGNTAITIPETTTEPEVKENEIVEISFDAFQGHSGKFETPEEFAEALEQKITEVGTIPSIKTEVIPDPDAEPEIEPSPIIPPPDTPVTEYPDVGDMGLPSLGDVMKTKFPFSLPFTFATIIGIFATSRVTPNWTVDLPEPLNTSFTIDLSDYEPIGYMLRWGSDIGFAIALLLATRKFIHW